MLEIFCELIIYAKTIVNLWVILSLSSTRYLFRFLRNHRKISADSRKLYFPYQKLIKKEKAGEKFAFRAKEKSNYPTFACSYLNLPLVSYNFYLKILSPPSPGNLSLIFIFCLRIFSSFIFCMIHWVFFFKDVGLMWWKLGEGIDFKCFSLIYANNFGKTINQTFTIWKFHQVSRE